MEIKELEQVFIRNLGSTITVELANGMLQSILKLVQAAQPPEPVAPKKDK